MIFGNCSILQFLAVKVLSVLSFVNYFLSFQFRIITFETKLGPIVKFKYVPTFLNFLIDVK